MNFTLKIWRQKDAKSKGQFETVKISGIEDLQSALFKHKIGETIKVVVKRDGKEVTLDVTLQKRMR